MIPNCKKEKILFDGKLYSKETLNLDFSKYKRLRITYADFDYNNTNTSGCSNIIELDLEKCGTYVTNYSATSQNIYNVFQTIEKNMSAGFQVNSEKTEFMPIFAYGSDIYDNKKKEYYVSRIIGILK